MAAVFDQMRAAELEGYALILRSVSEPIDYAFTAVDCYDGCGPDVIFWTVIPFVSGGTGHTAVSIFDLAPYRPSIISGMVPSHEQHHGIVDAWASVHIPGYNKNTAPTIVLPKDWQHNNATRAELNRWAYERTGSWFAPVDWQNVTKEEAYSLSERLFDAAAVPQDVRRGYYDAFDDYIMNLP